MNTKKIHYLSGIAIAIFAALHLYNHIVSIYGAAKHIEVMDSLRIFYRNIFVETILLLAVVTQIISGLTLFIRNRKRAVYGFEKLHIWTGLYLAIFFVLHLGAVFGGRYFVNLDTNFYFGVAGLNTFPFNLYFIPYYGLAILSIFGHMAAVHQKKMKTKILGVTPNVQSKMILLIGAVVTLLIFYGLTNHFNGVVIPEEYNVLIGK